MGSDRYMEEQRRCGLVHIGDRPYVVTVAKYYEDGRDPTVDVYGPFTQQQARTKRRDLLWALKAHEVDWTSIRTKRLKGQPPPQRTYMNY